MTEENQEAGQAERDQRNESQGKRKNRKPNPKTSIPARRRKTQTPPDLITR